MPEATLIPISDQGQELLGRLEAEAGVYPFRTSGTGERSYAADPDHLADILDRLQPEWREHLART